MKISADYGAAKNHDSLQRSKRQKKAAKKFQNLLIDSSFIHESCPILANMDFDEKINRLRLIRTPYIGPVTCRLLLQRYGTAAAALAAVPELSARGGRKLTPVSRAKAEAEFQAAEKDGAEILIFGSDEYPGQLARYDDAPIALFIKGQKTLLHKPMLAIVGARNASLNACRLTEHYAREIGAAGYVFISGMARGIDRAAHQGSLQTGTIAVLANGVDSPYPRDNEDIYTQITEMGLLVSEMPLGTIPAARLFPARNRIIASFCRACLVIEAALNSGSLITAREAADRQAEVMALPGSPLDPRAKGANALIQDGAHLIQSPQDVLDLLREDKITDYPLPPFTSELLTPDREINPMDIADARKLILENLSHDPIDIDELSRWCHVSAEVMIAALLELELSGQVQRHLNNRVSRRLEMS